MGGDRNLNLNVHQFVAYEADPFDTDNESENENEEKEFKFAQFLSNIAFITPYSQQYTKPKVRELMNLSVPNGKRHSMRNNVITPVPMKQLQSKSKSYSNMIRESSMMSLCHADTLEYIQMGKGGNIRFDYHHDECDDDDVNTVESTMKMEKQTNSHALDLMEILNEDLYVDDDENVYGVNERVALIKNSFGYKKVKEICEEFDLNYSSK